MTALTIIETGEIVEAMSEVEAERITSRIADKLDAIADNLEQVLPLIGEALTRRAWEALGYSAAHLYVEERFAGALSRLSPGVRRPVVAELSAAGMSTRQIAPIVGTSNFTVHSDIQTGVRSPNTSSDTKHTTHGLPTSEKIVGSDGKQYTRPAPGPVEEANVIEEAPKPRRRPITDQMRDAGADLMRAVERIQRLTEDDRYSDNAAFLAPYIRNAINDLSSIRQ